MHYSSFVSPRASKRIKTSHAAAADDVEGDEEVIFIAENLQASRVPRFSSMMELRTMIIAAHWQRDGRPGADFLNRLGLGCLTTIDWTLNDASLASAVEKFITRYDSKTHESEVDGRVIKLSPEMISRVLQLPNRGLRVDFSRRVGKLDRLNLFKRGAHTSQGFDNQQARDPFHARVFWLISEAIMFKSLCTSRFTGLVLLDWIADALEGGPGAVNWAEFLFQKLNSKLHSQKLGCFIGRPWIAHFVKVLREEQVMIVSSRSCPAQSLARDDHPEEIEVREAQVREAPEEEARIASEAPEEDVLDSTKLLEIHIQLQESHIRILTRKLQEAELRAEASREKFQVLEREAQVKLLELKEKHQVLEREAEVKLLEVLEKNQVLEREAEAKLLEIGEKNRVVEKCREENQVLEKKCSWFQLQLDSIMESAREAGIEVQDGALDCKGIESRAWNAARSCLLEALHNLTEKLEQDAR